MNISIQYIIDKWDTNFDELSHLFKKTISGNWCATRKDTMQNWAMIDPDSVSSDISDDFDKWKNRPEYHILDKIETFNQTPIQLAEAYITKLVACMNIRAAAKGKNPDECRDAVIKCLTWLTSTDFFDAPASAKYHDSAPHGLLLHTIDVINCILDLCKAAPFCDTVDPASAVLVAAVHDWCKIDKYEPYLRNVKDDKGNWTQVTSYTYKDDKIPLGHGETSAYIARQWFNLTLSEELAIVHHMQAWAATDTYHMNALTQANKVNPLNLLLAFADAVAITDYSK